MSHFDDDFDHESEFDEQEEGSLESHVWQLLLLINPGDEDSALQQFAAYREASGDAEEIDEAQALDVIRQVIDWRSGFYVDAADTRSLVQALDELASRWNLAIDWNGDPDDDEFHDDIDAPSLIATAYDRLAEHGYTVWAWEAEGDNYAGWITQTRDNEAMRELATAMGINLRLGIDVS